MQQPRHVKATDYVGQTSRRYRSPRTVPLALAPRRCQLMCKIIYEKQFIAVFRGNLFAPHSDCASL
jgi:hypothetical protein